MENNDKPFEEKNIIERHTHNKQFSLTGALGELDNRTLSMIDRIGLLELTLLEYFEKNKSGLILPDSPKIELLK